MSGPLGDGLGVAVVVALRVGAVYLSGVSFTVHAVSIHSMTAERKRFAAIYVRLSSYREDDTTLSPETQRKTCEDWCRQNGYVVAGVYSDLDVSGGSLNRPELDRLRQDWGRFDVVVASKIDRLSRSVRDFSNLHEEAQQSGVSLVAVRDQLDMSTAFGRFVGTIIAAFAEMELAIISERMRAGKETSRRQGRWQGGPVPFGFRAVKVDGVTELHVDDGQAAILRQAAGMRADGLPWRALTRWLQEVFPGRSWTPRACRLVLTNERLRGTVFTAPEFEALLRLCQPQKRADWGTNPSRLLSGMLRCGKCDARLVVQTRGRWHSYRCAHPGCMGIGVAAERLESEVEADFLSRWGGMRETSARSAASIADEESAELSRELRMLNRSLPGLPDDGVDGALQRRREIHARLSELELAPRQHLVMEETGRTLGEAWRSEGLEGRRLLLSRWWVEGELVVDPAASTRGPVLGRLRHRR